MTTKPLPVLFRRYNAGIPSLSGQVVAVLLGLERVASNNRAAMAGEPVTATSYIGDDTLAKCTVPVRLTEAADARQLKTELEARFGPVIVRQRNFRRQGPRQKEEAFDGKADKSSCQRSE